MEPTITVPSCQLVAALAWLSTWGPVSAVARQDPPATGLQTVAVLLPSAPSRVPATNHGLEPAGGRTADSVLEAPPPIASAGLAARVQT
jgi:hypothetical protein